MSIETKSRIITGIAMVEIAATILIMSVGLVKGFLTNSQSNIIVGVGLFLFWLLSDVVEPVVCERMKDLSFSRKEAYVKYIGLDLIGFAGIMYFLMGVGANGQSGGILGAVVYIVTMRPKRDNRDRFLGLVSDEEDEETEAEEAAEDTEPAAVIEGEIVSEETGEE